MGLIVQKYGGTSVGSPERIKNVARRVARWQREGHQVVVVVSAMSGETNRLIALAREVQAQPPARVAGIRADLHLVVPGADVLADPTGPGQLVMPRIGLIMIRSIAA